MNKEAVINKFDNKRVLIWGYGREGKSTESFLKRLCKPASITIFEGKREEICEDDYDYIIKSPGIVMHEDNAKYISQTQIFFEAFSDITIGVTGTKGKSTTSSMIYKALKDCGKKTVLLGNIGLPCLDYFEEIDEDTWVVYELSCHQLYHVNVSPHISVFLNLHEEHLDYYGTLERYFYAKSNITRYQKDNDYFIKGDDVPEIKRVNPDAKINETVIYGDKDYDYDLTILGKHNKYNAHIVYTIAHDIIGCDESAVKQSMKGFEGLPHRLKYVGTVNGIDCYDDSISTIPDATICAINSISNTYSVIIGGMDRDINYDILIDFIKTHDQYRFLCIHDSGKRIYEQVSDCDYVFYFEKLAEAVKYAKENTPQGKAIVLSPASASYGYFKNFEERGDKFTEYVLANQ